MCGNSGPPETRLKLFTESETPWKGSVTVPFGSQWGPSHFDQGTDHPESTGVWTHVQEPYRPRVKSSPDPRVGKVESRPARPRGYRHRTLDEVSLDPPMVPDGRRTWEVGRQTGNTQLLSSGVVRVGPNTGVGRCHRHARYCTRHATIQNRLRNELVSCDPQTEGK